MKHAFSCYLFLFSALLAAQGKDKPYVWPLAINNGISSVFQEFRSNHFHAGIDLRTFQQVGFPVLAVADGAIERIRVFKTGMGRSIYLRHDDGNRSTYGHLEKFRADIEAIVAHVQAARAEKYFGEYVLPEPLAVRRGDVIAFSGESGAGFAHLHLEIRDGMDGSINPLPLIGNLPADRHEPVLKGILVRTCGHSQLNSDSGEFYLKLKKSGQLYTLDEPLTVNGPFDLVLNAVDLSDVRHVVAPYSLDAFVNGQLYYRLVFDRLLRDDNNQLGMLYDMAYSSTSAYFIKLFFQSGFTLEKVQSRFTEIFAALPPGSHEIRVMVRDQQLNQAVAVIPFVKTPSLQVLVDRLDVADQRVAIHFAQCRLSADEQLRIRIYDDRGQIVYAGYVPGERDLSGQTVAMNNIPLAAASRLELICAGSAGIYFSRQYRLQPAANGVLFKAEFSFYLNRNDVVIKAKNCFLPAPFFKLKVRQGDQEQVIQAREFADGIYFCFQPMNQEMLTQLRFIRSAGQLPVEELQQNVHLLVLRNQAPLQVRLDDFSADFGMNTVLEPTVLLLKKEPLPVEYPLLAGPVKIEPHHFTFLDKVVFKFKIPPGQARSEQLGIFKYQPLIKKWRYIKTQQEEDPRILGSRVLQGGVFALLRDVYAPEIFFRPRSYRHLKDINKLVVRLRDRGKGIDEQSVAVLLNGAPVAGEFDPDWGHFLVSEPKGLRLGKNVLWVHVADFAGNRSEKLFHIHLK